MVTLTILGMLGILYALIVYPWPVPLSYRLFLGLIITWPVLGLYGVVELPAGIPDLQYHRGFVGLLLAIAFISAMLSRKYVRSPATVGAGLQHLPPPAGAGAPLTSGIAPDLRAGGAFGASLTRPPNTPTAAYAPSTQPHPTLSAETYRRQLRWIPIPVAAFVLFKGISVINGLASGSSTTAIAGFIDITLIPVAIYFLTKRFIVSRQRLVWLFGAIIAATLIVCLTGLYERVLNLESSAFPIAASDVEGTTRYMDVPGGRAAGVIGSPSVYGGMMGLGLLASLCCLVHAESRRTKLLIGGVAFVLAYGVFATFTRSAWISVSIALLFAQFYLKDLWKVITPVAVAGCLVIALMWAALQQNDVVQSRLLDDENVTGRIERFIWSWERFLEHPILGRGPNALNGLMRQVFPTGFDTSHNTYMTMLVDDGVIAFALFWTVILGWLAKAMSVLGSTRIGPFERSAAAVMVGFLAIWLMCGMSLELSYFPYYTALVWVAGATIERLADASITDNQSLTAGGVARG